MALEHREYVIQDLFSKGFRKLVPLAKNSHTPSLGKGEVTAIADDPQFWNATKLAENYHKFHNIAITFGPQVLSDGSIGYNHLLDVDSESVRAIIDPYLPELMKLTYIVQTKKGIHIHWIEHTQHERIGSVGAGRNVKRCMPDYDFELKTDEKGGTAHLPPSLHRDDVKDKAPNPFRYHKLEGCADKVGIIDDFMGSGLGLCDFLLQDHILGQHIREPNGDANRKRERVSHSQLVNQNPERKLPGSDEESREADEEEDWPLDDNDESAGEHPDQVSPLPLPSNLYFICADRIYELVDRWYVKDHRNNAMLSITGAIRKSWSEISYEDARQIITEFCKTANDEELDVRLATLRSTYEKEDLGDVAGFGPFSDILAKLDPNLSTDQQTQTIKNIRHGIYAALDDFKANSILYRHPNLEIDKSSHRHIVVFDHAIEEVFFPQEYNTILKETVRSFSRKTLLLNAAPVPPIQETWDPIYNQTKYKMAFQSLGESNKPVTKDPGRPLAIDELEEWLHIQASCYHKPGRLGETIHAIIDACSRAGLVKHSIATEVEGLVFLPSRDDSSSNKQVLTLSNMKRPAMPSQDQARAWIDLTKRIETEFYGNFSYVSKLETARHAHFIRVGVEAPIDFARRQSGAVNQFDILPRQDLGGWTDAGKTLGYAAIPLRMYRLPLKKGVGPHSYVVGSGSIDTAPRFIEQTRWTAMPIVFDEADSYSEWEEDREARRILSLLKNSTMLTNPRDTLTSDSEQITKPSASYVMLTHNSPLILEDGFSRRCIGHEYTIQDAKPEHKQKQFNDFWNDEQNSYTFGYLGDFVLNYYLDHPEVLNNRHYDIAKIVLRAFWVDAAGYTDQEFESEWNRWLGARVESATNRDALIESRRAGVVSVFRKMINDAWATNRQQMITWLAEHKHPDIYSARGFDEQTGKLREQLDKLGANASLEEKLEALLSTGSLTYLTLHPTFGVTMDYGIIKEMKDRQKINRVSLQSLASILGFEHRPIRFEDGRLRKAVHAPLNQFVKTIEMKGASE